MLTIAQALDQAVRHHQAGDLPQAEQLYRQILQVDPRHVDALHLLGVVAYQVGRSDLAVQYLSEALRLKPDFAEAHYNLGIALQEQRRLEEAVSSYRQATRLKPDYADAHNNLGIALWEQGRLEEAVASYQQALRLKPGYSDACNNLGAALLAQDRLEEAAACYREALRLRPDFAEAHNNLGIALRKQGKLEEAVASYREALRLRPGYADALNNLGIALQEQGRLEEAVASYRQALSLQPEYAEAHSNLGLALWKQGRLEGAEASHREALRLQPSYADAHNKLGVALLAQGRLEEALASYRRALQPKPEYAEAHSNLLFALQYRTGVTLAELAEAHAAYERQHAAPLRATWKPHGNSPDPERRLRLGFLSPDLRRHPVGHFLIRCLEGLDRRQAEAVCYSNALTPDDLTARFRATATAWWDVPGWGDERLAEQIRADRIDILFDLAGHTAKNRLLVFARKPAPVQITWLGYEGTTGLAAMDYLLADGHVVPAGAEVHYREQVLRMADSYVCYDPPRAAPPASPPPALERGYVTFGCCNNPAKITAQVIAVWARILRQVPESRLVLKYRGMDDPSCVRRFREGFTGQGIDWRRLELLGPSRHEEYLSHYQRIDVALDPFPFCGGVTTCDALWMGVPVITCPGETFAGRHSLSHLSNLGLTELVAGDPEGYVRLAAGLAGDLPRLAGLRAGLRGQMAGSPLCDGKRFAANLMVLLRDAWRRWVRARPG